MNVAKRWLISDHERGVGRHDSPRTFGGEPGDPGLCGPGSVSWRVNADVGAIAAGGAAAIIMEILHPSVMAGVQDQSTYAEDPFRRARTTFGYVVTTTFGNTPAATKLIVGVKRIHSRVNGVRPDGVPYRALDPELIGWVHTCIPWAIMRGYERYNRPLTEAERDAYLREQAVIGRMGGAEDIPETWHELQDYVEAMRPQLQVTEQTEQFFEFLLTAPFGPNLPGPLKRRLHRFELGSGMALMPGWAQELSGFRNRDAVSRASGERLLGAYARSLRWAYGEPPWARLAERRAAGHRAERVLERNQTARAAFEST
jgi:uncharacterized protein (DUF2236 family)